MEKHRYTKTRYMEKYACTLANTHTHRHMEKYTHKCTYTHKDKHTLIHSQPKICMHTHTHTHTHTHRIVSTTHPRFCLHPFSHQHSPHSNYKSCEFLLYTNKRLKQKSDLLCGLTNRLMVIMTWKQTHQQNTTT